MNDKTELDIEYAELMCKLHEEDRRRQRWRKTSTLTLCVSYLVAWVVIAAMIYSSCNGAA